ncbi:hypothetical protein JTB14_029020 [Gonioctena quinquepunctata]|nr:hypothetical protein JTB14_029020 [Gonioctena quinquepunctata]
MSPDILNDPSLTNLTEIDVNYSYKIMVDENITDAWAEENFLVQNILRIQTFVEKVTYAELNHPDMKKLIRNEQQHFDLIFVEGHYPLVYAFGYWFQAPVISISSLSPWLHCHDVMGNPTHPIYPDMLMTADEDYGFVYRLRGFLYNIWYRALFHWYILPKEDRIARKYFGNDMPYLGDIFRNTSLLMINVNPIMGTPRANVPNVVEISQMHIREKKPLPKDLQDYLDSSTNGVVYFSLGTNIDSNNLDTKLGDTIIQALSELPYNVIWKWDSDYLYDKPKNVLVRKWLPQQDILGHPNVKVFVTQGGLQSIEEAIVNEVPMVGLPFIVDQPHNIKVLQDKGLAIGLNPDTVQTDDLKRAIIEVAENERYKIKMQEAAAILRDQPMKGVEKAVYWIEYVLRHKGAKHLRSPAADMPLYKYFMVDVVLFLLVSCFLCIFSIKKVCRIISSRLRNEKVKKN